MDFELNQEQKMILKTIRDFSEKEIAPKASELDKESKFPIETLVHLKKLGLFGMCVGEEFGGSNIGPVSSSLVITEIAHACASTSVSLAVTNMVAEVIYKFGSNSQKEKYLKKLLTGAWIAGSFALTEPEAGSNAGAIKTRAELKNNSFLLNGTKVFVTNGGFADVFIVFAKTNPSLENKGISAFIIEKNTKGLIYGKEEDKMGLRGSSTIELTLDNVEISKENLIGEENNGFKIAMYALNGGRIGVASQCIGIGYAALAETIKYCKEREQFGKPLASFQGIRFTIAEHATKLKGVRLLTLKAAHLKEQGKSFTRYASEAKLYASELVNEIVKDAVQFHGAYGFMKDYLVERLFRDARVTTIYEGTSEIQKLVIAKEILKM
jgi:alkylation response protein AidB-like acyl-CoA dehydrogenase